MPVIPSFSFDSRIVRQRLSTNGNANPPNPARTSPQPHLTGSSGNLSPRSGDSTTRASTSAANGTNSRATSRSRSTTSSSSANHSNHHRYLTGEPHSRPTQSFGPYPRHDGGSSGNSSTTEVARSRYRSADVPLFTGEEAEAVSPGRRFMNIHRRARRGRVRSEAVYGVFNTAGNDHRTLHNTPDGGNSGDYHVAPPAGAGASSVPTHALGGATTGASLRRSQYASSTLFVEERQSGLQLGQLRGDGRRLSLNTPVSSQRLGASNPLLQRSGTSSGGESERNVEASAAAVATGPSAQPNVIARADITILVAPPPVQLTTSVDVLRRLTQRHGDAPSAACSAPASECECVPSSASGSSSTSSSIFAPATPVRAQRHLRGEAMRGIHTITTSTGWQRARAASSSNDDNYAFPGEPGAHTSRAATTWQLPVLIAAGRGHVTQRGQQVSAASLRSASSSSRGSVEGSASIVDHPELVGPQLRRASQSSNLRSGCPHPAPSRSSREVSWVQPEVNEEVALTNRREGTAPSLSSEGSQRAVSQSANNRIRFSPASLRGARNDASAAERILNDTSGSLVLSQSLSSFDVAAASSHRQPSHGLKGNEDAGHARHSPNTSSGVGTTTIAAERTDQRNCGAVNGAIPSSSNLSHKRCASPPAALAQTPPLVPGCLNDLPPSSPTQVVNTKSPSNAPTDTNDDAENVDYLQLPAAKDGVVLLNHVHNVPAQGELYRLLRVFNREPLQQFPQALRGPPLAVRLPDAYNSASSSSSGSGDSADGWCSEEEEGDLGGQRRDRRHRRLRHLHHPRVSRSGSIASDAVARSRSRSSSTSTRSTSQVIVEVNASNPRALFTRLVLDPADCAVEVLGLPSPTLLPALSSSSPHRSCSNRAAYHRHSNNTTTMSGTIEAAFNNLSTRELTGGIFDSPQRRHSHGFQHARSAFNTSVRNSFHQPRLGFNGRSLPASTSSSAASRHGSTPICQAEVVANGFFNADVRQQYAQSQAEAARAAEAEYGEGCYYTLPFASLSSSSPRVQEAQNGPNAIHTVSRRSPVNVVSEEAMELLPRFSVGRKLSSRIQCVPYRFTTSDNSASTPLTVLPVHGTNSNHSGTSRAHPPQPSPEPLKWACGRLDMQKPRSGSLEGFRSVNDTPFGHLTTRASTETPQNIGVDVSHDELGCSPLNESCSEAATPADAYAPMMGVSPSGCTPARGRSSNGGADNG